MSSINECSVEQFNQTYEVLGQIGKGGAGVVVKAIHKRLNKYVVIKRLNGTIVDVEKQRAEVDILKNLRHPYLPTVYDFFIMNNSCFTVMDFIDGVSLGDCLKKNTRFSEKQIVKYSKQLCEVVEYLHSQRFPIIHGDIKPDNIILTPDNNICLIDFNISSVSHNGVAITYGCSKGYSAPDVVYAYENLKRQIEANKKLSMTAQGDYYVDLSSPAPKNNVDGSTALSSLNPEFLANSVHSGIRIDKRSDVFSIGATMFHMYSGTRLDKSNGIKVGEKSSDGLIRVINKSLSDNPNQRYQSAGEMLNALSRLNRKDKEYKVAGAAYNVVRFIFAVMATLGILMIFYGYNSLDGEREERYYDCIKKMERAREKGDVDELSDLYNDAIAMRPENAQAYYQMAAYYYDTGDYIATIDYIYDEVPEDRDLEEDDYIAGIYDILADSFFESEQYSDAAESWELAIKYNDEIPSYYRNLAVAYVMNNQVDEAEDILDKADDYDLTDDGILLIRAEIEFANGDYLDAEESFEECIRATSDDRTMYMAYVGYSDSITGVMATSGNHANEYNQNLRILQTALSDLPEQYTLSIHKRVADIARRAYIEYMDISDSADSYFDTAISSYEWMAASGWMNEVEYYNYIDLYIKAGDFTNASRVQADMDNAFTDSLLAAESHAFLERQIQLSKPADQRNYAEFNRYYLLAQGIANRNGATDERLMRLGEIYAEVNR